jgi:hypothetical protein
VNESPLKSKKNIGKVRTQSSMDLRVKNQDIKSAYDSARNEAEAGQKFGTRRVKPNDYQSASSSKLRSFGVLESHANEQSKSDAKLHIVDKTPRLLNPDLPDRETETRPLRSEPYTQAVDAKSRDSSVLRHAERQLVRGIRGASITAKPYAPELVLEKEATTLYLTNLRRGT